MTRKDEGMGGARWTLEEELCWTQGPSLEEGGRRKDVDTDNVRLVIAVDIGE